MYIIRHWWDKYVWQILLISLALGVAWTLRETQGAAIFEAYQIITRPFQSPSTSAERLNDARMLELQAQIVELKSQNQKLQELLNYTKSQGKQQGIVAPVVGRSADHWWQQITLGRGSEAGIQVGFTVTAPGGLVGRIISVTPNTSRVLLISDRTSQLGVTISRSRSMGTLQGQSSSHAVIRFFNKVPTVRRGDIVATSPYSQMFPSGLPVGKVESVNIDKSPAPEATIALAAPLPNLEWVVVYPNVKNVSKETGAIIP